jgi:hypothetical protein
LVAFKFETIKELIEAAEAPKACLREGQQEQYGLGKRKEVEYTFSKPPLPIRGKRPFNEFKTGGVTWLYLLRLQG